MAVNGKRRLPNNATAAGNRHDWGQRLPVQHNCLIQAVGFTSFVRLRRERSEAGGLRLERQGATRQQNQTVPPQSDDSSIRAGLALVKKRPEKSTAPHSPAALGAKTWRLS